MHRVSAKQNVSGNHQQKQACVWGLGDDQLDSITPVL